MQGSATLHLSYTQRARDTRKASAGTHPPRLSHGKQTTYETALSLYACILTVGVALVNPQLTTQGFTGGLGVNISNMRKVIFLTTE